MTPLGAGLLGFALGVGFTLALVFAAIVYLANHLGYKTVRGFIRGIPSRAEGE